MPIFEKIFQELIKIETNKNKQVSKMFLFTHYFTPTIFSNRSDYSSNKYIKYKFFILKNYLKVGANFIDNNLKEDILRIFSDAQKHIMILYRFKKLCILKTKKYLDEPQDLQFNLLSETPNKHTIDIIHTGIRYQFSIFDLIRIINTSLSYEYNFFTDPKKVKNPWNNNPFSVASLYNIYFFICDSNIKIPILFERFFQSNFNLDMFERHNQLIIKNYIIENCHNFSKVKKLSHIYIMLDTFNRKRIHCQIKIDDGFPENRLLEVMEPYLKTYLLSVYSYEDDLLIKYRSLLVTKLRRFNKNNPTFGRKIISLQIKKLYYISCLYYNEKTILFIPYNVYIPKQSMISLKNKCYYIDYFNQETYTIFPSFQNNDNINNATNINTIYFKTDIAILFNLIKKCIFTDEQLDILKEKYYSDVLEQMRNINRHEEHDNHVSIVSDIDSDIVSDIDSDADSVDSDADSDADTDDGIDVNLDDGIDIDLNNEIGENNDDIIIEDDDQSYTILNVDTFTLNDIDDRELNRLIELLNINDLLADDDDDL